MVYRFQLPYDVIIHRLDLKYFPTTTLGYTLPLGINEIFDINFLLKSLLSKEVKVFIRYDDIRLKTNLTLSKQSILQKNLSSI